MEMIWFLVKVILVLEAAQVVLAPLVLYYFTRQAAKPEFKTFHLLNPPLLLPPSYGQNIALLEEVGFHVVAHLFGEGQATTVRSVLTLFVNDSEKDMAIVVHMLAVVPPVTRKVLNYIEFCSEFEDGSEINTNNARQISSFVQVPEKAMFRLPHITDPRQLYAFHRAMVAQRPPASKRLPPPGDEVSDLVRGMERDLALEAGFGRLRLDDSGLWYRPTAKGAILNSIKFGWLVKFLRLQNVIWRGKRMARVVLGAN